MKTKISAHKTTLLLILAVSALAVSGTGMAQEGDAPGGDATTATVVFDDQSSDGRHAMVQEAQLTQGGFLVLYNERILDQEFEEAMVGVSDYLDPGTHEDVRITLDPPLRESEALLAIAHMDTTGTETFQFVESGFEEDGFYPNDEAMDNAMITVDRRVPGPAVALVLVVVGTILHRIRSGLPKG